MVADRGPGRIAILVANDARERLPVAAETALTKGQGAHPLHVLVLL
jgi:hypothetical protein